MPTRELVDATADGIPLVRVGVERVIIEVGILLVRFGIDAEDDGEEGASVDTADQRAQRRRPRHPRGGARLVATGARPQEDFFRRRYEHEAVEAALAEDAALHEAITRSLEDLVPADNALPMDAALA
jgi:hypothetical protein